MSSYGVTFRTFRKNKGYTLQQVAEGIVSISFLSKFERGDSDISFSVMVKLLERLTVTYEEFYFLHNREQTNAIDEFFNRAEAAYAGRDISAIHRLKEQAVHNYKQSGLTPFQCNVLLLEVYRSMIELNAPAFEDESLEQLKNYFFDIETWGYYELRLYNSTLFLLPPESTIFFSKSICSKIESIKKLPLLHNVFIRIMLNTVTYLTGGQNPVFLYEEECRTFMNYLDKSDIPEGDLKARVGYIQAQAYLDIRLGHTDKGVTALKRVISLYNDLGAHKLAKYSTNYLDIMLSKNFIK